MGKGAQRNPANPAELVRASGFTNGGKAAGLGVHKDQDKNIAQRAAEAMKPIPGMAGAPHKGLTQPGVAEAIIELAKAEGGLAPTGGVIPRGYLPTSSMKISK